VTLGRLPAPVAFGRDIKGSIRILFQKLVGKYFGSPYRYPLLLTASVDDTGEVVYSKPEDVQARVAEAHTIVLFIHGIIGDTRAMVHSAYKPEPSLKPHLAELYDLVLAFDYENLNTSIEQTAHDLQDRLRVVGLGPGHGKRLHIIAHSLGGLIARWFIEHLDGKTTVEHLVMLGTPNGGSPWPRVQALATAAVGLALNALTVVPWPLSLLGGLSNGIEAIDVTLDQMQPGAQILHSLWQSPDPHVHYTVIAGNTSIREEALASEPQPEQPRRIERLMERLSLQHMLRKTTALAFFGQPNDIAVSVASITHVPLEREPRPAIKEIACDHMTYFRTDAALRTLANLLSAES
jgi:pimeloyl-ACP methyl ester carboxylesterase